MDELQDYLDAKAALYRAEMKVRTKLAQQLVQFSREAPTQFEGCLMRLSVHQLQAILHTLPQYR